MSSFLDEFFTADWPIRRNTFAGSVPAVNVEEREKDFSLSFAVPGKNKDDFEIEVDKDVLSVSANTQDNYENTDERFSRREFSYQSFKRSFTLPDSVDTTKIKAKYTDGILTIDLPKRKEALPQPTKRIAIE
jgi:HSP20 family protein